MKYRFLTLISSLLLLTACSDSFLERAPEGNYVDVTFYTSDKALQAATAPALQSCLVRPQPAFHRAAGQ